MKKRKRLVGKSGNLHVVRRDRAGLNFVSFALVGDLREIPAYRRGPRNGVVAPGDFDGINRLNFDVVAAPGDNQGRAGAKNDKGVVVAGYCEFGVVESETLLGITLLENLRTFRQRRGKREPENSAKGKNGVFHQTNFTT
jgi:hypothetical protein